MRASLQDASWLEPRSGPGKLRGQSGAALVLATCFLFVTLVLLAGGLAVSQARRERVRKTFSRDLVESEARALLPLLRLEFQSQVSSSGDFDLTRWTPAWSGIQEKLPDGGLSPLLESSFSIRGTARGGANPALSLSARRTAAWDPLSGARTRSVTSFSVQGRWVPAGQSGGASNLRADTPWQVLWNVRVEEMPMSLFNCYAAQASCALAAPLDRIGRARFEYDLLVQGPLEAGYPLLIGGALAIPEQGALIARTAPGAAAEGFGPNTTPAEIQAAGSGAVFTRDAFPETLCRPASTQELFSSVPLSSPGKERQRLKPQCVLQILHRTDSQGSDKWEATWKSGTGSHTLNLATILKRNGASLELDLGAWPGSSPWVPSIWVESSDPAVASILVRNAQTLSGDFSMATPLEIQIAGSFNTGPVERRASLLTLKRVVALPN